jgi:hypothetical protein
MPAMSVLKVLAAVAVAMTHLWLPAVGTAHGDLASDYLLDHDVFLPLEAEIDPTAIERLADTVRAAQAARFAVKVVVVGEPADLGALFNLYRKPQRYAAFLNRDLGAAYDGRIAVVMPNGYGYAFDGQSDARVRRALATLTEPGADATKEVEAAAVAVRSLAAAAGREIVLKSGGSQAKDRVMIALAATAGVATLAGLLLYRRKRRTLQP